jgi:hypothetical protein
MITSAPKASRSFTFSRLILSGMVKMSRYPRGMAASASATPVFPLVPSTMVPPGWSVPRASAAATMASPMRSLTEPPGSGTRTCRRPGCGGPRRSGAGARGGSIPTRSRTESTGRSEAGASGGRRSGHPSSGSGAGRELHGDRRPHADPLPVAASGLEAEVGGRPPPRPRRAPRGRSSLPPHRVHLAGVGDADAEGGDPSTPSSQSSSG